MRHARLRPVEFVDIVKSALIKLRAQGVFLHHERIRTAAASCRIAILFFLLSLSLLLLCSFLADKQKQSHMQKVAIAVHLLHKLFFELTHTHDERHKGRIERLRVLLAYGFEARTQHQLSSSRHDGRTQLPGPHMTRHQPKGDMDVVWFHIESNCLDHNEFVHHLAVVCASARGGWWSPRVLLHAHPMAVGAGDDGPRLRVDCGGYLARHSSV